MFTLKVDKTLTTYLKNLDIRIEELFVIHVLTLNNLDLLKEYLSNKSADQCTVYLQSLERKNLIKKLYPELVDFEWDNYELTDKAVEIYSATKSVEEVPLEEDIDSLVNEFIELYPVKRNAAGEYLRGNKTDVKTKFKKFIKTYDYSKETILEATKQYLKAQMPHGYQYCSQSHYFILKDGVSKLANECEKVLQTGVQGDISVWDNVV